MLYNASHPAPAASNESALQEMLIELKAMHATLAEGLNVTDGPEVAREDIQNEAESSAIET